MTKGFFSTEDTSDPNTMAEYLATCVMGPCRLITGYSVEKYKQALFKSQEKTKPTNFRYHSCVSYALITTYKILGHMASIPIEMGTWSPKLFVLLTQTFYQIDYFKKVSSSTTYTCTNIPVLVAILVYLEWKEVLSFEQSMKRFSQCFIKRGALKCTRKWRMDGAWPQKIQNNTWVSLMPFTVATRDEDQISMQLHEAIILLLYGTEDQDMSTNITDQQFDLPGFRTKVNAAIQDLTYATIVSLVRDGKGKLKPGGSVLAHPSEDTLSPTTPPTRMTPPHPLQETILPETSPPKAHLLGHRSQHMTITCV
jgi:hypothetical protein